MVVATSVVDLAVNRFGKTVLGLAKGTIWFVFARIVLSDLSEVLDSRRFDDRRFSDNVSADVSAKTHSPKRVSRRNVFFAETYLLQKRPLKTENQNEIQGKNSEKE